ncbi:MAG: hypothetical protein ACRCXZ_01375, partial [Patescibacteria group bacterium]
KGNLEIDHWAAVFVSSHTVVVADNSIYSLNSYQEAFFDVRLTENTMWLDFHDLAHNLDVCLQGGVSCFTGDKVNGSVFNTPSDLIHIMSADNPKSSFALFLAISQTLFDDYLSKVGKLDLMIHKEEESNLVDYIGSQVKEYLLGRISIQPTNTSYYEIPSTVFCLDSELKARELTLIGEANLGEGFVVWLEQYLFCRSVYKNHGFFNIVDQINESNGLNYKQWRVIYRQMGIIQGILLTAQFLIQPGNRYSYGPERLLLLDLIERVRTYRFEGTEDLFSSVSIGGKHEFSTRGIRNSVFSSTSRDM